MGWNVNSLSNYKSQLKFINKLRGAQENVFILSDIRLDSDKQRAFSKMWGEGAYFNSYSSSQRGLAVLFKDSLPVKDIHFENIIDGNFSKLTFKVKEFSILIKCLYAPNEDMPKGESENLSSKLFKSVFNDENEEEYDIKAVVGDFNVALNHNMDTAGYLHVNNPNTRDFLSKMIPLCNLTDIWRHKNPNTRSYKFFKKQTNNYTRARLDYFLLNDSSTHLVKKIGMGKICSL